MTKDLGCRDIERLILEREETALGAGDERLVRDHLRDCARCRDFEGVRARMRERLSAMVWPSLPAELDRRARRLAGRASAEPVAGAAGEGKEAPPGWVFAALAIIIVLIAVWSSVTLADVEPGQALADLPFAAKAALMLIAQNAFVLFFAPVILKAVRPSGGGSSGVSKLGTDIKTRRLI